MFETIKRKLHELIDVTPEEEAEWEVTDNTHTPSMKKVVLPPRKFKLILFLFSLVGAAIMLFFVVFHYYAIYPNHVARGQLTVTCSSQETTVPGGYVIDGEVVYKLSNLLGRSLLETPYVTTHEIRIYSDSSVTVYPVDKEYLKNSIQ